MKYFLKNSFVKVFDPFIRRLGYIPASQIERSKGYSKNELLFTFFSVLKEVSFEPKHIIDIGANQGTWTREALRVFPNAYYTLLEPQYWMEESISDLIKGNKKIRFFPFGAGKVSSSMKFTLVERDDSCSFRYSEEEAMHLGYKQIEVLVVTIQDLIIDNGLPTPDLIKIDAEGCDLDVLEGIGDFFQSTEVFMIEVGIVNKKFENSALRVMNYMDLKGFRLFDITDINRPFAPQALCLGEFCFVKKGGFVEKSLMEKFNF